jgi:archaemetzincin
MSSIRIIPILPVDHDLLVSLIPPVSAAFSRAVTIDYQQTMDPFFAFDYSRNQYNSTALLAKLLQHSPEESDKVVGITGVDLFVPVLTYVFGEAQLLGPFAVVSHYRLDEKLYGMPSNRQLLTTRLVKEVIHELGHCFGLIHCRNYECVMRSSTAVEEIDVKPAEFCRDCTVKLHTELAFPKNIA